MLLDLDKIIELSVQLDYYNWTITIGLLQLDYQYNWTITIGQSVQVDYYNWTITIGLL